MLTIADGGGIQEPQILADMICEQPLNSFGVELCQLDIFIMGTSTIELE